MDTFQYMRKKPGGMYSILDRRKFPEGSIWWVDSTNTTRGSDTRGYGQNPDHPFLTLVYAEAAASEGDTIFVMAGHAETIGANGAAGMTLNTAGLKIIGLGGRTRKPAILVDAYDDTYISIAGADTALENLTIKAGHLDIASGIIVTADGVELRGLSFVENASDENFLECITDGGANTADLLLIEDCEFNHSDTDNTAAIQLDAAHDRVIIRNNLFVGDWGTAAISIGGVCTNICIGNNYISNAASDNDSCINCADGTTGLGMRNLAGNAAAIANQNVFEDVVACQNFAGVLAEDTQGILDPIAT